MNILCFMFGHKFDEPVGQEKLWKYRYCARNNCEYRELNPDHDKNWKQFRKGDKKWQKKNTRKKTCKGI